MRVPDGVAVADADGAVHTANGDDSAGFGLVGVAAEGGRDDGGGGSSGGG